jgi:cyclophilin family peptidyl-prolyl cis-trans isomerase
MYIPKLTRSASFETLLREKGKPDQSQGREATDPRFPREAIDDAPKDPKSVALPFGQQREEIGRIEQAEDPVEGVEASPCCSAGNTISLPPAFDDQPALDYGATRNPDKQGFATFGRVVSGMDVVLKIHSVPANRFIQEEGYTGGQILKEPVRIISARID